MPRLLSGALLCAALAPACRSPRPAVPEAELALSAAPLGGREPDVVAEAIRSLEQGEHERARELLDEILIEGHLERARSALAAGVPEDALLAIDQALTLAPLEPEVRLLKADASLRLAEAEIARGGSGGLIEGALTDALEYYRNSPESAHALFGASRAAWLLSKTDVALDFARRGLALRASTPRGLDALSLSPERIYAEQVYAAYGRARDAESGDVEGDNVESSAANTGEAAALFLEAEDGLTKVIGRASDDPWAWSTLSDLYEWEGRLAEARGTLERGLQRAPEDEGLLARLARVSANLAGPSATVSAFEAHLRVHGELAAARWHLGVARFQQALAGFRGEPRVLDPAPFEAAEAGFAGLRARHPELAQAARGYEVVCRLARGWCAFHSGDLERAQREFLAMDELFPRGIEWSLEGQLESGIQGLFRVADAHSQENRLLAAGEVFETLHALQPESALWANNAGFFLREAGLTLEGEGLKLCRAARGRMTNAEALLEARALAGIEREPAGSREESAAFEHAGDERFELARALMQRSWSAYRAAAELAPEDLRVVNDAALVQVYYLHDELAWAEQALLRCVELGVPELAAKRAALAAATTPAEKSTLEAELDQLTEAWGDAHQNLGVLAWVHAKDAASARTWLEKSVEIWPARQPVTNSLLPQVRGELAPRENDPWDLLHWAQPCNLR